jgi:formylglycine-generating enzyme required for sulfatase activity
LVLVCALAPANAEKRVALVVGNGAYRHAGVPKLDNPVNDARGMRDALAKLGFDVLYGEDLDLKGLQGVIGRFADRVENADVAMVYFAGHGATFGDTPYVVPVDAAFSSLRQVPYELVPVETLIGELRQAKGVRIAVLDACRDNGAERELKRQAARGGEVTRGLAPMKNPSGLIIAYATQYGATAADDVGGQGLFSWMSSPTRHSPFTTALLNNIATPGLDVKDMFYKVGREVNAATGGSQRPEISISMYEQYALAAGMPATPPALPAPAPPVLPANAPVSGVAQAWGVVQNTTSLAVLDDFIRQFGNAPVYGSMARARREEVAREQAKNQVAVMDTPVVPPRSGGPQARGLKRGDSFKECADCPEMVVVPAGSFTMGSPPDEKDHDQDEEPQHVVTIRQPFAVGKLHVTRDQFAAFVNETGYAASSTCGLWPSGGLGSWREPGFEQEGSHPVVCVSWDDAKAYVGWIARKTGKPYRLLTEAEFEYAARGRTQPGAYPRFWFGDNEEDLCKYGNIATYNDTCSGSYHTSPAGYYQPNAFGLYDMFGNAWQWTEDCWHGNYYGAPADGSAWTTGACNIRIDRGGSWDSNAWNRRAAKRQGTSGGDPRNDVGFRVARTLPP